MIILGMLTGITFYLWQKFQKTNDFNHMCNFYIALAILLLTTMMTFMSLGWSKRAFETQKETRKTLEYQLAHPNERDVNFFEKLTDYNKTVVEYQELNRGWFLNGIGIIDHWDNIQPIDLPQEG